jgi:hypothetical protein
MRVLAGLCAKSLEGARVARPNTFFAVTIRIGSKLVGMERVVGGSPAGAACFARYSGE